jgi:hypothetical protein
MGPRFLLDLKTYEVSVPNFSKIPFQEIGSTRTITAHAELAERIFSCGRKRRGWRLAKWTIDSIYSTLVSDEPSL